MGASEENLSRERNEFFFFSAAHSLFFLSPSHLPSSHPSSSFFLQKTNKKRAPLSHLPVSHHGLSMLKRENAKPVPMTLITPAPGAPPPEGYPAHPAVDVAMASVTAPPGDLRPTARLAWAAPSFVRYRYSAGPSVYSTNLYATPTTPGSARVFLADAAYPMPEGGLVDVFDGVVVKKETTTTTTNDAPAAPKKLEAAARPAPPKLLMLQRAVLMTLLSWMPFIRHWMQGTIFDGDGILLAGQAKRMASLEAADASKRWPQLYYMPASCDVFVTQLRRWLDREAGGGPQWAPGVAAAAGSSGASASAAAGAAPPAPGSREERKKVLDRRAQHVRLCTVCQKGEKQLRGARNLFVALAGAALLALAAVVGGVFSRAASGSGGGGSAVAAAACVLVAALAGKAASFIHSGLLPNFGFRDYVHAHKD